MNGLLGGLFSYGDGLKRKLNGLLSDPAGTVQLGAQRMADDTNALTQLAEEAGLFPGSRSVLVSPQQRQNALSKYADKATEMGGSMMGATVWHGSPHKFSKFDSSKIGTGEGAQAYGHGLYLAESPEVARTYRSAGADPSTFTPVRSIRDPAQMASTALERAGGDMRHAIAVLSQNAQSGDITAGAALQMLKQRAVLPESKYAGNMYKVDLPDEHIAKMLDWDKPLHRQTPEVRKAVRGAVDEALGPGAYGGLIKNRPDFQDLQNNALENLTQAQIAEALRQRGLNGIRYLDGGSRGAGQGSSNYVVFPGNEGLLKILQRNGQDLP